jgi:hypothetical protein
MYILGTDPRATARTPRLPALRTPALSNRRRVEGRGPVCSLTTRRFFPPPCTRYFQLPWLFDLRQEIMRNGARLCADRAESCAYFTLQVRAALRTQAFFPAKSRVPRTNHAAKVLAAAISRAEPNKPPHFHALRERCHRPVCLSSHRPKGYTRGTVTAPLPRQSPAPLAGFV